MVAAALSAIFGCDRTFWKALFADCHTAGAHWNRNSLARLPGGPGNLRRPRRVNSLRHCGILPVLRHARYGFARDRHDHLYRCLVRLTLAERLAIKSRLQLAFWL